MKLVYVEVLGKSYPEKRPADFPDNGKVRSGTVYEVQLSQEEYKQSLDALSLKYPMPAQEVKE